MKFILNKTLTKLLGGLLCLAPLVIYASTSPEESDEASVYEPSYLDILHSAGQYFDVEPCAKLVSTILLGPQQVTTLRKAGDCALSHSITKIRDREEDIDNLATHSILVLTFDVDEHRVELTQEYFNLLKESLIHPVALNDFSETKKYAVTVEDLACHTSIEQRGKLSCVIDLTAAQARTINRTPHNLGIAYETVSRGSTSVLSGSSSTAVASLKPATFVTTESIEEPSPSDQPKPTAIRQATQPNVVSITRFRAAQSQTQNVEIVAITPDASDRKPSASIKTDDGKEQQNSNCEGSQNLSCFSNVQSESSGTAELTLVNTIVNSDVDTPIISTLRLTADGPGHEISGIGGEPKVTNASVVAGIYRLSDAVASDKKELLSVVNGDVAQWSCAADQGGKFTGSLSSVVDDRLPSEPILPGLAWLTLKAGDDVVCTLTSEAKQFSSVPLSWALVSGEENGEHPLFESQAGLEPHNTGFSLYYKSHDGPWRDIDGGVFVPVKPSARGNHIYRYEVQTPIAAQSFAIVNVAIYGSQSVFGPFALNEAFGELTANNAIDWDIIKQQNTLSEAANETDVSALRDARKQQILQRLSPSEKALRKQMMDEQVVPLSAVIKPNWPVWMDLLNLLVAPAHATEPDDYLNFSITEQGVYKMTHSQLMGFSVDFRGSDITRIGLENSQGPVAIKIGSPSSSGNFQSSSFIEFIGEPYQSIYSSTNIYTLTLGDVGSAEHVNDVSDAVPVGQSQYSYLAEVKYEPRNYHSVYSPEPTDAWYADDIGRNYNEGANTHAVNITLDHYAERIFFPASGTGVPQAPYQAAKFSTQVWGSSDLLAGSGPDHMLRISINDSTIINTSFDGIVSKTFEKEFSDGMVSNGTNPISFHVPMSGRAQDLIKLNSITLNYPRRFVSKDGTSLVFRSSGSKFTVSGFDNAVTSIFRKNDDGSVDYLTNYDQQLCGTAYGCTVSFAGNGVDSMYYVYTSQTTPTSSIPDAPSPTDLLAGNAEYLIISHPLFLNKINTFSGYLSGLNATHNGVDVVSTDDIYAQYNNYIVDASAIHSYIKDAVAQRGTEIVLLVGGDTLRLFR